MNATEPYVSVVQFGKLYRVVQILSLSRWSRYVWLFKRKLLSLWYTIVYLKSGSNFRVCVKFQNVAIKFKFTEIETKNGSNFESG